jgi:hypothetical protein
MNIDYGESPFLLVEHGKDGLWHVHERTFDTSGIIFQERQAACDYASERARRRADALVLLREYQEPPAESVAPKKSMSRASKMLGWVW